MAVDNNKVNALQSKQVTTRIFTKKQKQKLIQRFQNEMIQKEKAFKNSVDNEIKLLRLKFHNRLNKILRKFWDVKLGDVIDIEREMTSQSSLTLFHVIKQLEIIKSKEQNSNSSNTNNDTQLK
jgi:hypothetical protein